MFLSDNDIRLALQNNEIEITDFDESRLQQASYDIRLGNKFLIINAHESPIIDPVNNIVPTYREVVL